MNNYYDYGGRVVIVTGAERGIGLAMAVAFAKCGANIVVAGILTEEFANAQKQIEAEGVKCKCIVTDVSDETSVINMVETVKKEFGHIDILINNAGINKSAPAENMPLEFWQKTLNVNLTGTFLVSREVAKVMLEQGKGNIINIASMSGLVVNPLPQTQCAYNSSKAGVIMLTKCMANEWAERGIRVNAIAPGFMRTPLTKKRLETPGDESVKKWISGTPLKRIGVPEELTGLALYLASDAAAFTTGVCVPVDGGYSIV